MVQVFSIHESSFEKRVSPTRGELLLFDPTSGRVERWRAIQNPHASRYAVCLWIGGAYYRFKRVEYTAGKPTWSRARCQCDRPTWRDLQSAPLDCACGAVKAHAHCQTCGRTLLAR